MNVTETPSEPGALANHTAESATPATQSMVSEEGGSERRVPLGERPPPRLRRSPRKRNGRRTGHTFHSFHFAHVRREANLWDKVKPQLAEVLDQADRANDFPDYDHWYQQFRRSAMRLQSGVAKAARRFANGFLITVLALLAAVPLASRSIPAYLVLELSLLIGVVAATRTMIWALKRRQSLRLGNRAVLIWSLTVLAIGYLVLANQGLTVGMLYLRGPSLTLGQLSIFAPAAIGCGGLAFILGSMISDRIEGIRVKWLYRSNPGVATLSFLFEVIEAAKKPSAFVYYEDRSRMIGALNISGWLIRTGLPRVVRLPDPGQRVVFEDRCRAAAHSVEALMIWVALPSENTHSELRRVCALISQALITGRYDELPLSEGATTTSRQRLRAAWGYVRLIVSGAIPALVLIGVRKFGVVVDGTLGAAATIFCIAWAAVTYLQLLDPLLAQRISTMREMIGALRGGLGGPNSPTGR